MKRIVILLEEKWHTESLPDAAAAVRAYQEYGFDTDLWILEEQDRITGEQSAIPNEPTSDTVTGPNGPHSSILSPEVADTLFIADSAHLLRQLADAGAAFCAYSHGGNSGEDLSAAEYILMEPQWVDEDSLVKIWQRQRHLPWSILETERCLVREFVPDDLDGIYALYDEQASRFLEPPSDDRAKEREILCSYIEKMYPLCGYGHWAVIGKESGELIGRMGFSFRPAEWAGPEIDACFGYLLRADRRGRGITGEVCRALLEYGFMQLGFEVVGADASVFNSISVKILKSFGFETVAERGDQRYYILNKRNWRNRT